MARQKKRREKARRSDMKNYRLPLPTALFVFCMLTIIELAPKKPIFLLERLFAGGGWLQVILVTGYAFVVAYNMQDPAKTALWRQRTWLLFSVVFFGQLLLGLTASSFFLLTGKLHLPIPALIIAGPLFRGESSMMPFMLLTTLILSGPAWCSHICYFGGLDGLAATGKVQNTPIKNKKAIKLTILLAVVVVSLLLRHLGAPTMLAVILALIFGMVGIGVMMLYSRKQGRMVHCILYCPIGTIVNYAKFISPFRLQITQNCCDCGHCSTTCKYDALGRQDIASRKPGSTCSLCGDCLKSCPGGSIQYRFFRCSANFSRNAWLFITISLHAITLAVARI